MTHFGIVGAGNVGAGLARALTEAGHAVTLTNSDPAGERLASIADAAGATAGSLEACLAADVVVLAAPYEASLALATSHADALAGTIVLDATNPLTPDYLGITVGFTTSAAETIQAAAPEARVVKALNTVFASTYANPTLASARLFVPVAGDDAAAKEVVLGALAGAGFDAVDMGALSTARYIEPTVMNLIHLAFAQGHGANLGLALVRG